MEQNHGDGVDVGDGGSVDGEALTPQNVAAEMAELLAESSSAQAKISIKEASMKPIKPHGKEYARRVAYIMRSYLNTQLSFENGDKNSPLEPSCSGYRCRAMMEVSKKETGRWLASKVVLDHAHLLTPQPDSASTVTGGILVPAIGMEFDSISIAKAFYNTYSEKMGFKARTGFYRRSSDNQILKVHKFMCSQGTSYGNCADEIMVRRKEGYCKKRASKTEIVVLDDSTIENSEAVDDEMAIEGQYNQPKKIETFEEKDGWIRPSATESDFGNNSSEVCKGGQMAPFGGILTQSCLLRELGIRVSRYTHEERRNIILRYIKKRNNRQVVDRSMKVPSRQALAERRQRGFGGKFLSKEETQLQAFNKPQKALDEDPEDLADLVANDGGVPIVGMRFDSEEKAYEYYVTYAANLGFSVRKGWWDKSAKNVTRSRVYVCSREGFRPKNASNDAKKSRPETRTGCPAKMAIKATSYGRYLVAEFIDGHNHQLALPLDIQMQKSQKLLTNVQHRNQQNSNLIPVTFKNYIRAKRTRGMETGYAGTILEYLQKMKGCNPSFYYAIQVDEDDKMTNVFWSDARSIMDYYYFGDAVCFYTPFRANACAWPLAVFIGVNHHKQAVIFGSAFVYDETQETFKWLFEVFQNAMAGKQPRSIFTDQCVEIDNAIAAIWPGTRQRLCTLQIYQHASKHLGEYFKISESFAHDFSRCVFDFDESEEFMAAWAIMIEKYSLKKSEWLLKIFEKKEKWAQAYSRDTFCADLQFTLRNECLLNTLNEWLSQKADLSSFLSQYDRLLIKKRFTEQQADYHVNQGPPILPHFPMLWQAARLYTPAMFEIFRRQFELFMNCAVYSRGEIGTFSEYEVTLNGNTGAHFVRFDSLNGTIICSCKKYIFIGIQCCHVLKVLDFRNIKELPQQYILKRWRKDAKTASFRDSQEYTPEEDPSSSIAKRYSSLCRILYRIAERAAENMDAFTLISGQSDQLIEQAERILTTKLIAEPALNSALKGQLQNPTETQVSINENCDAHKLSFKRRKETVVRSRMQVGLEMMNKRHKSNNGPSEECNVTVRDLESPLPATDALPQLRSSFSQFIAPSHFMQGPYITGHQFGISAAQGFHVMTQFGQDSPVLPQAFHGNSHLNQPTVPGYPTQEMHPLQFVGNNSQLVQQGTDQAHCNIPVWDFL